ncbi:hypothetical protein BMS3Bbin04_01653 [bacterium BMS3Bbin04]|nr:hypothetical protein BMS3Bbin04_01653 [bacterium BMS3Bbin04]
MILRDQQKLVSQILEAVIHRGCREQQHFGVHTGPQNPFHQKLVPRSLASAVILGLAPGVIAEVVRLINDHEIIIAPIVGFIDIPPQIGVSQHSECKPISEEGVACIVFAVDLPVIFQLFGAENEHATVEKFKVLYDRQRFERFSQADTVCDDAAVMLQNLVDRTLYAVLLEIIKHVPHAGFEEAGFLVKEPATFCLRQVILKNVEERLEVNELRRMVLI